MLKTWKKSETGVPTNSDRKGNYYVGRGQDSESEVPNFRKLTWEKRLVPRTLIETTSRGNANNGESSGTVA